MSALHEITGGGRSRALRSLGVAATFSGAALVMHILTGMSLRLALVVGAALVLAATLLVWRRASPRRRAAIAARAGAGLLSGAAALIVYDVTKWALSLLDPSPFDPFEALRVFGILLVGEGHSPALVLVAGSAFHALNGLCFGVAFAFLLGRRGVLAGIGWGLFLEVFQLALYPGWLGSAFLAEFIRISALGHLAYGATLGLVCRRLLAASPEPPGRAQERRTS